jgi:hypothetical protein
MKKMNEIISVVGIIFLLIFLAGCTSSNAATQSNNSYVGMMEVGPTPTPFSHTIIGVWKIDYNGHVGTIEFKSNRYINIDVSGYPGMSLQYIDVGNNTYSVSYLMYSEVFKYNFDSDTVTSDGYPGVKLTRLS